MSYRKVKKGFKVVIFPVGSYDTAGNKRLKNLANKLKGLDDTHVSFIKLLGDNQNMVGYRVIYLMRQLLYFPANWIYTVYSLAREFDGERYNLLYFYEGKHVTPLRVLIAKIIGYRITIDMVEDPVSLMSIGSVFMKARMRLFLFMYRIATSYVDFFVVVSVFLKKRVEKDFNNRIPVYLLPVTYDNDDFNVEPRQFGSVSLLYGGSFGPNYDFRSFLSAVDKIQRDYPEIRLCLTGKIDVHVKEMVRSYIKDETVVMYLGFLSSEEYFKAIKGAHILLMPRNNTVHANAGFPFKLAEYLASGNPVITSVSSDVREYLTEDDAFLYEAGDTNAIESYIRYIIDNPVEATRRGFNGKQKASIFFDSEKVASGFFVFVKEIFAQVFK